MPDDLPEKYQLSFYLGEIVRNDTWAENEVRNLWFRLASVGLSEEPIERDFARVIKDVRRMLRDVRVPAEFRRLALEVLEATHDVHRGRARYVHQILIQPPWKPDELRPATDTGKAIHMSDLVQAAEGLRVLMWRIRALWIIAPHWLGDASHDEYSDRDDMVSWTRVAMGHIRDDPHRVVGTSGPAPEPPGGYRNP
jgi:hypothetical protein